MVTDKQRILIPMTIAFILPWAYLLLPYSEVIHQMFPFDDQKITYQAYFDYLFTRISILIIMSIVVILCSKYREYLFTFWLLWIGYIIDYLLFYNQPYGWWHSVPLCYGLYAGLGMIFITFITIWKQQSSGK